MVEGKIVGILIDLFTQWVSYCLCSAEMSLFRRKMAVRTETAHAPGDETQLMSVGLRTPSSYYCAPTVSKKIF